MKPEYQSGNSCLDNHFNHAIKKRFYKKPNHHQSVLHYKNSTFWFWHIFFLCKSDRCGKLPFLNHLQKISLGLVASYLSLWVTLFALNGILGNSSLSLAYSFSMVMVAFVTAVHMVFFFIGKQLYGMGKLGIVINNFQAIQDLANVDVILLNKSGALTRNEITITHIWAGNALFTVTGKGYYPQGTFFKEKKLINPIDDCALHTLGKTFGLLAKEELSDQPASMPHHEWRAACRVVAQKMDVPLDALDASYQLIYETSAERLSSYHIAFYKCSGKGVAFYRGLPELLFEHQSVDIKTAAVLQEFLQSGLHVIAVAHVPFEVSDISMDITDDYAVRYFFETLLKNKITLVALCGLEDTWRPEAPVVVRKARKADLIISMFTNEHQYAALAVAKYTGLYREGDEAITGAELQQLSESQLQETVKDITVFSQVTSNQLAQVINAHQKNGLTVAIAGFDSAQTSFKNSANVRLLSSHAYGHKIQEADIILFDDSLATIMKAIECSRKIIHTLQGQLFYVVSAFFSLFMVYALATIFVYPQTIAVIAPGPVMFLIGALIVMLTNSCAGNDSYHEQLTNKKKFKQPVLSLGVIFKIISTMLLAVMSTSFIAWLYLEGNPELAPTMIVLAFTLVVWLNIFNTFTYKSFYSYYSNPWFKGATMSILVACITATGHWQEYAGYQFYPLNLYQLVLLMVSAVPVLLIRKIFKNA